MKIYFRALPMLARSPKRITLAELLPFLQGLRVHVLSFLQRDEFFLRANSNPNSVSPQKLEVAEFNPEIIIL